MKENSLKLILNQLKQFKVIPVIRTTTPELASTAIEWLIDAGFSTFEITLTIPNAFKLISHYANHEDFLIGAGTVTSVEQAESSLNAGAKYLVSPCVIPELPKISHKAGVPCFLGALTPTELLNAVNANADAVKIFPVNSIGGFNYIKALTSVFPQIPLIPTGGVSPEEIALYFKSGATFVGIGNDLINDTIIHEGKRDEIIQLGQKIFQQLIAFSK